MTRNLWECATNNTSEVIWQLNNNTNRVLLCSIKTPINVSCRPMFLVKHNISNNSSGLHVTHMANPGM